MAEHLHIDFESRSAVDLRKTGVYRYAEDPTTDIWCVCYAFDDGPVQLWQPGAPCPEEIEEHITLGRKLWAHNSTFERIMHREILMPRYGWPEVALEQWYCTAAMAAAMGLPRALGSVAAALGLEVQKDAAGRRLMLQMARPRDRDGATLLWWDTPERRQRLAEYCRADVEVERLITTRLLPLTPREREIFLLDARINDRGVAIDRALVDSGLQIVATSLERLNGRLAQVTGGAVSKITAVVQLTAWLAKQGCPTASLDKGHIEALLAKDLVPAAREALEIRAEAAKSSTAKLQAMHLACSADDRARGVLLYYGARTGRWAGRLIQPQNFPRGEIEITDQIVDVLLTGDAEMVELLTPLSPMATVSAALRACLVAAPGHELIAADFANIEGRVLAWLAGEDWKLDAFCDFDAGTGPDLYKVAAAGIYNVAVAEVTKDQRFIGKVSELALGYQGGKNAFKTMASNFGVEVEDERAEGIKLAWRAKNPAIVRFWWALQRAAWNAVQKPGQRFDTVLKDDEATGINITYLVFKSFLWCKLPSGRMLAYAQPHIARVKRPWDDEEHPDEWAPTLCCMGVDHTNRWGRVPLYGGLLAENVTSGIARDLLADAMLRVEAAGYPIVLSIHDEIVTEVPEVGEDCGSVGELEGLLGIVPQWAAGCPIAAAGFSGKRFKK